MYASRFDEFVRLLIQLSPAVWEAAVVEEPEWKWMQPLSSAWAFGHFAALFMVLGLNDYQTKGKADVGYWPKIVPLVSQQPDPKAPPHLIDVLEPFYRRERFAQTKCKRLGRFTRSDLCHEIWVSNSTSISADFGRIWRSLGCTMHQQPTKKTIAFAMKCLALALLMVDEIKFDFGEISVPVDSRIRNVSNRLGVLNSDGAAERERWRKVLERIRESHSGITMVHLDSLLWQIGTLPPREVREHLEKLGAGSLALRLSRVFGAVDVPISSGRCHA